MMLLVSTLDVSADPLISLQDVGVAAVVVAGRVSSEGGFGAGSDSFSALSFLRCLADFFGMIVRRASADSIGGRGEGISRLSCSGRDEGARSGEVEEGRGRWRKSK